MPRVYALGFSVLRKSMRILFFSSPACLPCDRAAIELGKVRKEYPNIEIQHLVRPDPAFAEYDVVYTPTLIVSSTRGSARLTGAHEVKKMEIIGLIRDLKDIRLLPKAYVYRRPSR